MPQCRQGPGLRTRRLCCGRPIGDASTTDRAVDYNFPHRRLRKSPRGTPASNTAITAMEEGTADELLVRPAENCSGAVLSFRPISGQSHPC